MSPSSRSTCMFLVFSCRIICQAVPEITSSELLTISMVLSRIRFLLSLSYSLNKFLLVEVLSLKLEVI